MLLGGEGTQNIFQQGCFPSRSKIWYIDKPSRQTFTYVYVCKLILIFNIRYYKFCIRNWIFFILTWTLVDVNSLQHTQLQPFHKICETVRYHWCMDSKTTHTQEWKQGWWTCWIYYFYLPKSWKQEAVWSKDNIWEWGPKCLWHVGC